MKNKIKFILLFIVFTSILGCNGKAQKTSLLVGKWDNYKTEFRNGVDTIFGGDKLNWNSKWEFTKDNYFINIDLGDEGKFPYRISNDTIYFGFKSVYVIETLSEKELVVMGINPFGIDDENDVRQYFRKVKSFDGKVEGP